MRNTSDTVQNRNHIHDTLKPKSNWAQSKQKQSSNVVGAQIRSAYPKGDSMLPTSKGSFTHDVHRGQGKGHSNIEMEVTCRRESKSMDVIFEWSLLTRHRDETDADSEASMLAPYCRLIHA